MPGDVVDLNFLQLLTYAYGAVVHVRPIADSLELRPYPNARAYNLPAHDIDQYTKHWVSIDVLDGYETREVAFQTNPDLSCWVLFESLRRHLHELREDDQELDDAPSRFVRELRLPMDHHDEGICTLCDAFPSALGRVIAHAGGLPLETGIGSNSSLTTAGELAPTTCKLNSIETVASTESRFANFGAELVACNTQL